MRVERAEGGPHAERGWQRDEGDCHLALIDCLPGGKSGTVVRVGRAPQMKSTHGYGWLFVLASGLPP